VTAALFDFDNSYADRLDGLYVPVEPAGFPDAELLVFNEALAQELALDVDRVRHLAASVFSGTVVPPGAMPLAQAYAGHQFGQLSPQLGDGRALLLGEVLDAVGDRRDIQLKGAGRTPFSRGGDGRATLGPVLREYLMGEAMHHLGVETTRALAAVRTGETVVRDASLPGAVLTRVAASHIRIGTFQFFAVRGDMAKLLRLTEYTIARHYPQHLDAQSPALRLLREVAIAQARLVTKWMLIGFVHGVMNTDNVSISGETIDYGPCAFMEAYDPDTVFSSIDHHGRYAYGNQPAIGKWNLARFAESLLPLISEDPDEAVALCQTVLAQYEEELQTRWVRGMGRKIGLQRSRAGDEELIRSLLALAQRHAVDFTTLFRRLSDLVRGSDLVAMSLFADHDDAREWVQRWLARMKLEAGTSIDIAAEMDRINPVYIPRNHKVEAALAAAIGGNLKPFNTLLDVLSDPFVERPEHSAFAQPAPASFGRYTTFCGT